MNQQSHPMKNAFHWILTIVGVLALCAVGVVVVTCISLAFIWFRYGSTDAGMAAIEAAGMPLNLYNTTLTQIACAIVLILVWIRMYRRSILRARAGSQTAADGARIVKRILLLLVGGLVIQTLVAMLMGLVFRVFPSLQDVYSAVQQTVQSSTQSVVATLPITIGAPIFEELLTRGLLLECLLRAFQPDYMAWREQAYPEKGSQPQAAPTVSRKAVVAAIFLQALVFGIIHVNPVQVVYATAMGIILGWVAWRTGKLRYSMLLHFATNGSAYIVGLLPEEPPVPLMLVLVAIAAVVAVLLVRAFARVTEPEERNL